MAASSVDQGFRFAGELAMRGVADDPARLESRVHSIADVIAEAGDPELVLGVLLGLLGILQQSVVRLALSSGKTADEIMWELGLAHDALVQVDRQKGTESD